ncbi:hypothetical protein ACOIP5_003087 [Salmonella enterica]
MPGLPFFDFMTDWRSVPAVSVFLDTHYQYVNTSMAIIEGRANVWIVCPDVPDPVAMGAAIQDDGRVILAA